MNILAIDSCSFTAAAAVCDEDTILCESTVNTRLTHSQTLLPAVQDMLKNAHLKLEDIDLFAVAAGPGSFTGIRIGLSAVKAMAFALNKPCIGVSSLTALAYGCRDIRGIIVPVMDARAKRVYCNVFDNTQGKMRPLYSDGVEEIATLAEKIENLSYPVFFVGDGAKICYTYLQENVDLSSLLPSSPLISLPRGSSVAYAAFDMLAQNPNAAVSPQALQSVYIQIPQAQRQLRKAAGNKDI